MTDEKQSHTNRLHRLDQLVDQSALAAQSAYDIHINLLAELGRLLHGEESEKQPKKDSM